MEQVRTEEHEVLTALRARLENLIDERRAALVGHLDGLTEDEARLSLVPSITTLLGLVKHVNYVERFYLDHLVSGRPLSEIGVASTPHRSFMLTRSDTIASITAAYRETWEASREAVARRLLSDTVDGARGERAVWSLLLEVFRELAHHSGHADILREQVIAARESSAGTSD